MKGNFVHDRPNKERLVLEALAEGLSISAAAARADISKVTVYRWRKEDPEFARAFLEAVDTGTDRLEDEALRRAVEGTEETVYHNGAPVGVIRKKSDTLLIFMLKGRRPEKFRDNYHVEMARGTPLAKQDDQVMEILDLLEKFVRTGDRQPLKPLERLFARPNGGEEVPEAVVIAKEGDER